MNVNTPEIEELIAAWQAYLKTVDWQTLIAGIEPKIGGCGKVYELDNPLDRPNESFAIADMRGLEFSEPHKHINGETEIYFILEGMGKISLGIGDDARFEGLQPGVVIVTPPDTPHGTYSPHKDLVLAVVNTPPFDAGNVVTLNETDAAMAQRLLTLQIK